MKKLLLLVLVLVASANAYSQTLSTGNESGTTSAPTGSAEIALPPIPPVRDGDPQNPDPDPPSYSACPDHCFENRSRCPVEVVIYYSAWEDCRGAIYSSTGMQSRRIVLQPGERECFGFGPDGSGCCISIHGNFYFGVSGIGKQPIVKMERNKIEGEGVLVNTADTGCDKDILIKSGGPDAHHLYIIINP